MSSRTLAIGLPLLTKELLEQSARRRTYVIRTVYAVLLFFFCILIFWGEIYDEARSPFDLLGKGREMFGVLMGLQTAGILLFTPALTCGAITAEKERNTFGLLMLTKLGPWTILLEKYLGRLVTMGTYLLLSIPLLGFCYSLGGLEQKDLWGGIAALTVTIIQVAAIGIFCSAFFRTTVAAFLGTYVIGFLVLFGPPIADEVFDLRFMRLFGEIFFETVNAAVKILSEIGQAVVIAVAELTGSRPEQAFPKPPTFRRIDMMGGDQASFMLVAPIMTMAGLGPWNNAPAWHHLVLCLPALFSGVLFLLLARVFVIRRAFATPKYYLMRFFRGLDGAFQRLNQNRVTRGVVLVHDSQVLPEEEPVAWRETKKKSLGTFRYLVRIFVALEFPVVFFCLVAIMLHSGSVYWHRHPAIILVTTIAWLAAVMFVSVKAATLVSGERSHETLDVLLSTPIGSDQFVREKFKGVTRLMWVMAIPLLTAMAMQTWFGTVTGGVLGLRSTYRDLSGFGIDPLIAAVVAWFVLLAAATWLLRTYDVVRWRTLGAVWVYSMAVAVIVTRGLQGHLSKDSPIGYLLGAVLSVAVYLPLVAWLSFYIGLRMKTQTRAIFTAMALLVAWCILPLVILVVIFEVSHIRPESSPLGVLLFSSPLTFAVFNEAGELDDIMGDEWIWLGLLCNFTVYGAITLGIRRHVLANAAELLGRTHTEA